MTLALSILAIAVSLVTITITAVTLYLSRAPRPAIQPERGKQLDRLAELYGLKRARWESDQSLRSRCLDVAKGVNARAARRGPPEWLRRMTGR